MQRDVLERLLIDRSVGALEADAQALLDAYLEGRPETQAQAAAFDDTAALVKGVLARDAAPSSLPPLRLSLIRQAGWSVSAFRMTTALAACLLLGMFVGLSLPQGATKLQNDGAQAGSSAVLADRLGAARDKEGFWSARRLLGNPPAAAATGQRVIWDSPVTQPRLGGAT